MDLKGSPDDSTIISVPSYDAVACMTPNTPSITASWLIRRPRSRGLVLELGGQVPSVASTTTSVRQCTPKFRRGQLVYIAREGEELGHIVDDGEPSSEGKHVEWSKSESLGVLCWLRWGASCKAGL